MTDNSSSLENSVHSQVDEGDELRTCKTFEERLAKRGIFKKKLGSGATGIAFTVCTSGVTKNCKKRKYLRTLKVLKGNTPELEKSSKLDYKINRELNVKAGKYTPHVNRVESQIFCPYNRDLLKNQSRKLRHFFKSWSRKRKLTKESRMGLTVMELGDIDFLEFIRKKKMKSVREMKEMIFQVVYTLAVLQYHVPGFKHGDLKENNVVVYYRNKSPKGVVEYDFCGKKFKLNSRTPRMKLIDFDLSMTDENLNCKQPLPVGQYVFKSNKTKKKRRHNCDLEKSKFWRQSGLSTEYKPFYDLHYFLNTLLEYNTFPSFEYFTELSKMLPRKFIAHYLEDEIGFFYIISKWRLVIYPDPKTEDLYTPTELLLSGIFDDLMVPEAKVGTDVVESYSAGMDLREVLDRKRELLYNPDHEKFITEQMAKQKKKKKSSSGSSTKPVAGDSSAPTMSSGNETGESSPATGTTGTATTVTRVTRLGRLAKETSL